MQVDFGTIEEQAPAIDLGLKLNGKDVKLPAVKIYAPTESGEAGLFLKSQGEGEAPTWEEVSTNITINGETIPTAEASIFAPTDGGEGDQILQSQGPDRAPEWRTFNPFPVGMITPFAGSEAPEGWLLCDGSEYAYIEEGGGYSKYISLFRTIRYTYGGEGETFRVPDLRGKFLEGASTTTGHKLGNSVSSALPAPSLKFTGSQVYTGTMLETNGNASTKSTGSFRTTSAKSNVSLTASGAFSVGSSSQKAASGNDATSSMVNMNVQHIHSVTAAGTVGLNTTEKIYGKSTVVQPESICVNYIIKY